MKVYLTCPRLYLSYHFTTKPLFQSTCLFAFSLPVRFIFLTCLHKAVEINLIQAMTFLYRHEARRSVQPVQCFHHNVRGANLLTLSFIDLLLNSEVWCWQLVPTINTDFIKPRRLFWQSSVALSNYYPRISNVARRKRQQKDREEWIPACRSPAGFASWASNHMLLTSSGWSKPCYGPSEACFRFCQRLDGA